MRKIIYNILSFGQKSYAKKTAKRVRVLAYHSVLDPDLFERHISFFKKYYEILDIEQFQTYLKAGSFPENSLLITFDDGDTSVFKNGLPVLQKYGVPAVLFVITSLINSYIPFWWEEIDHILGKEKGFKKIWEVKKWENAKRENYLNRLRTSSAKAPLKTKQLTTAQLKVLQQAGVTIAGHSHTHPMFNKCSSEELLTEIENSQEYLRLHDFNPYYFAYPNGNFSRNAEDLLKTKGIELAFLFDHRLNSSRIDPLRISRIRVDSTISLAELKVKVSGLHPYIFHSLQNFKK